jgi:hypothetical protein
MPLRVARDARIGKRASAGAGLALRRAVTVLRQGAVTTRGDLEKLLDIKREKGRTWKCICGETSGMAPILSPARSSARWN